MWLRRHRTIMHGAIGSWARGTTPATLSLYSFTIQRQHLGNTKRQTKVGSINPQAGFTTKILQHNHNAPLPHMQTHQDRTFFPFLNFDGILFFLFWKSTAGLATNSIDVNFIFTKNKWNSPMWGNRGINTTLFRALKRQTPDDSHNIAMLWLNTKDPTQ